MPAPASRDRRAVTAAMVVGIAAAAIAIGAIGMRGGGTAGDGAPTGGRAVEVSQPQMPAAPPAASPAASPAATPVVAPPPAAAPAAVAAVAAAADPYRAEDADRESRRFAEEAQDTEGDGDERLTQLLRDTQYAYRDAAAAAAAGDAAGFATTRARADQLARVALARLDGDGDGDGDDDGD